MSETVREVPSQTPSEIDRGKGSVVKSRARVALGLLVVAAVVVAFVMVVRRGREDTGLAASGTVEATEADLGFQTAGRIARVDPKEGDVVSAGQELAALDPDELEAARTAAAAQVDAARARLAELERGSRAEEVGQAAAAARAAREREDEAGREAARAERLFEGGAVSKQDRDKAASAHDVATASRVQADQAAALVREGPRAEVVQAQRAQVAQAEANLDRSKATLENAVITAPFSGRVTVRHREPGETVAPGAPVVTLLNPADRWVRIYVPEDRIGRVSIGQSARISADSYPDKTYTGRVVHIGSEAEFTPRNVQTPEERTRLVYPVKVQIIGDAGFDLKPGVPADVELTGAAAPASDTTQAPR